MKKVLLATSVCIIQCDFYHAVAWVAFFLSEPVLDICKRCQVTFGQI